MCDNTADLVSIASTEENSLVSRDEHPLATGSGGVTNKRHLYQFVKQYLHSIDEDFLKSLLKTF